MTAKAKREIELHPDAMERFERAVKVVAKSLPQHRIAKKASKKNKPAKRVVKTPGVPGTRQMK